ncbi:MAG: TetR family transcriptional regulator C-terminal domain-containing protein [Oribacterium sp.]|nr:TetR family transcriptional regulator C-terminal domain-containing protein [Oribacterium sp.]
MIERLTHTLEENRHMIRIMLDNHLELMLVDGANHVISKLSGRLFHAEQDSATAMYTRALISGAIVNAIIFWIEERMPVSSRELNEIILKIIIKIKRVVTLLM